jgi:hypothetical protein
VKKGIWIELKTIIVITIIRICPTILGFVSPILEEIETRYSITADSNHTDFQHGAEFASVIYKLLEFLVP